MKNVLLAMSVLVLSACATDPKYDKVQFSGAENPQFTATESATTTDLTQEQLLTKGYARIGSLLVWGKSGDTTSRFMNEAAKKGANLVQIIVSNDRALREIGRLTRCARKQDITTYEQRCSSVVGDYNCSTVPVTRTICAEYEDAGPNVKDVVETSGILWRYAPGLAEQGLREAGQRAEDSRKYHEARAASEKFIAAAQGGDLAFVRSELSARSVPDDDKTKALLAAAEAGQAQLTALLIVSAHQPAKDQAFLTAARADNRTVLQILIKDGTDPMGVFKRTAATEGSGRTQKALLDDLTVIAERIAPGQYEGDPIADVPFGGYSTDTDLLRSRSRLISALIRKGSVISNKDDVLYHALYADDTEVTKKALALGADVRAHEEHIEKPVVCSANAWNTGLMYLKERKQACRDDARTDRLIAPAEAAASFDSVKTAELLVDSGASPRLALCAAVAAKATKVAVAMLDRGVDPNLRCPKTTKMLNGKINDEESLLVQAARNGNPEVVQKLLEKGAKPYLSFCQKESSPDCSDTLLQAIASNGDITEGHLKSVAVAVERGLDVKRKDRNGKTELTWARAARKTRSGDLELEKIIKILEGARG